MERALEDLVWERARHCCKYCRMPKHYQDATLRVEGHHFLSCSEKSRIIKKCLAIQGVSQHGDQQARVAVCGFGTDPLCGLSSPCGQGQYG
jgi:hypothetical protein